MNLFAKFQRMFAKISFIYGFGGKPTPRPLPEGKGVRKAYPQPLPEGKGVRIAYPRPLYSFAKFYEFFPEIFHS